MPIYEYECGACGHTFERLQKMTDNRVRTCPECGERKVERVVSAPAIRFKGSGWYVTDYSDAGKEKAKEADREKSDKSEDKKSDKSEGKKTDKSTSKAESKSPSPGDEKSSS